MDMLPVARDRDKIVLPVEDRPCFIMKVFVDAQDSGFEVIVADHVWVGALANILSFEQLLVDLTTDLFKRLGSAFDISDTLYSAGHGSRADTSRK